MRATPCTSTQDCAPYEHTDHSLTKIMLTGMTDKAAIDLLPLARSWNRPAKLELVGKAFQSQGYDPTQRAYMLTCDTPGKLSALDVSLAATSDSPVVNPAFVVKNWGTAQPELQVNGKKLLPGRDFRAGYEHSLRQSSLIIWLRIESTQPLRISLSAAAD